MASSSRPESNGSSGSNSQGLRPSSRRAFGCVTWLYMGILFFLGVGFLLSLPFRYIGNGELFAETLGIPSLVGLALILPGMALAALLGSRTYRSERRRAIRVGTGIGAIVGWTGFFSLAWLESALGIRSAFFEDLGGSFFFYIFIPLALVTAGLVLYGLFSTSSPFATRRRLVLIGGAVAIVAGVAVFVTGPSVIGLVGLLVTTLGGAAGGWAAGIGYARAGGDDMIPPGATIRRREPRRKRGG